MRENAITYSFIALLALSGSYLIYVGLSGPSETPPAQTQEAANNDEPLEDFPPLPPIEDIEPEINTEDQQPRKQNQKSRVAQTQLIKKDSVANSVSGFDGALIERLDKFDTEGPRTPEREQKLLKQAYELLSDLPEEIINYTERTGKKVSPQVLEKLAKVSLYAADNDASDYPSSLMSMLLPTYQEELRRVYQNHRDPSALDFFNSAVSINEEDADETVGDDIDYYEGEGDAPPEEAYGNYDG